MLSLRWGVSWPTSTTCTCSRGALHLTAYFGPIGTRLLISGGPLIKHKIITLRLHKFTITNNTWSENVWTIVTEIQESGIRALWSERFPESLTPPTAIFQVIIIHVFLCYAWYALRNVRWDWRMQQNFEDSVKSFWFEVFENSMTQWSLIKKTWQMWDCYLGSSKMLSMPISMYLCVSWEGVKREMALIHKLWASA